MAFKNLTKPTIFPESSIKIVNFNLFSANNHSASKSRSLEKDAFRSLSMERLRLYNEIMDKSNKNNEEKNYKSPKATYMNPKSTENTSKVIEFQNKKQEKPNEFQNKINRETPSKSTKHQNKNEISIEKFTLCSPKTVQKNENSTSILSNYMLNNGSNFNKSATQIKKSIEIDLSLNNNSKNSNHQEPRSQSQDKKPEKNLHRSNSFTRNEDLPLYSPSSSKNNLDVNYNAILTNMKQKLKSPKNNDLKGLTYLVSPTNSNMQSKKTFPRKNAHTPTLRGNYTSNRSWFQNCKENSSNSIGNESKENIPPSQNNQTQMQPQQPAFNEKTNYNNNQSNISIHKSLNLPNEENGVPSKKINNFVSERDQINNNIQGNNENTKKTDFQEYKRLQEKLLFLENRIVEMKSNFESAQKTCFKECKNQEKDNDSAMIRSPQSPKSPLMSSLVLGIRTKERSLSQDKATNVYQNQNEGNSNINNDYLMKKINVFGPQQNKNQNEIISNNNFFDNNAKTNTNQAKYSGKPPQPTQINSPKNRYEKDMLLYSSLSMKKSENKIEKIEQNNEGNKNEKERNDRDLKNEKLEKNINNNKINYPTNKPETQSISLKSFVTQVEKGHFLPRELEKDEEFLQKSAKRNTQDKKVLHEKKTNSFTGEEIHNADKQNRKKYNSLNKKNIYYISTIIKSFLHNNINNEDPFMKISREHFQQTFQSILFVKTLKPISQSCIDEKKVYLPQKDIYKHKKTLIFDLDETLIHCNENALIKSDIVLPIKFPTGQTIEAGINIRPYTIQCLKELANYFEIIVFTASHNCYANVVLDYLDPEKEFIQHRLFREHCIQTEEGLFVKDLRVIENRSLENMLIVDNAAYSFGFQLDNGIPILPYYDNKEDRELVSLTQYLKSLKDYREIRDVNKKMFRLKEFSSFQDIEEVLQGLYGDLAL